MSANSGGQPPQNVSQCIINNSDIDIEEDMEMASPISKEKNQDNPNQPGKYYIPKNITANIGNITKNKGNISESKEMNSKISEVSTNRINYKYRNTDMGPYHIYVDNTANERRRLNAMKVGDIILSNWPEIDNKIKSIDSVGNSRIRIQFKDYKSANYILDQKNSAILKNNNLDVYIPKFLIFRQGVVRGISTEYSEDMIKNRIKEVDHHCKFDVEAIRRIKRKKVEGDKVEYVDTQTCVIIFKCQTLPKYIAINKVIMSVEPYIQKVLLCYNCYRYGHLGKQCKSISRCNKCGDKHKSEECTEEPKCIHCKGDHSTLDIKKCPEFSRQKQIKTTMSQLNISYNDASKQVPKNSYASVLSGNTLVNLANIGQHSRQQLTQQPHNNQNTIRSGNQTFPHTAQPQSQKYSITSPIKRTRPSSPISPDPVLAARQQITTPVNLPSVSGGVLAQNAYSKNIQSPGPRLEKEQSDLHNIILDLVIYIISTLKNNNNLDIHKQDLETLIRSRLHLGTASNSQL